VNDVVIAPSEKPQEVEIKCQRNLIILSQKLRENEIVAAVPID